VNIANKGYNKKVSGNTATSSALEQETPSLACEITKLSLLSFHVRLTRNSSQLDGCSKFHLGFVQWWYVVLDTSNIDRI